MFFVQLSEIVADDWYKKLGGMSDWHEFSSKIIIMR